MIDALACDAFLALIALAAIRLAMLARRDLPAGYGALVMAVGIFAHAAWRHLPFSTRMATEALALVLLCTWLSEGFAYLRGMLRGTLAPCARDPIARFAIATWVAGTAVAGVVTTQVFPSWHTLVVLLTILTVLVWLWFLSLLARGGRAFLREGPKRVTGSVLLATVSTQAVLIFLHTDDPAALPDWICLALLALGCAFYACGMILLVLRYGGRSWRLAEDWHGTNCIIHGAVSITGLAAVSIGAVPLAWAVGMWLCAALFFALVEGIELARLRVRVAAYGWRRGALAYDVSQWARVFTFGMFYAFTLALYPAELGAGVAQPVLAAQHAVLRYGQYGVLGVLVVEVGLFLSGLQPRPVAHRTTAPRS